ncbi:MAG: hypothetical protein MUE61_17180 [Vicinamibacterales bacterium]|jgi:hypothetical protein|nr:hypothetical protein [Vicinamibacterales bacterium]
MMELAPGFDEFFGSLIAHGVDSLPFIWRAEFIRNRRAAGRLEDLADIEAIGG